jgi:glucose/mannose transport system substrate-binding protein
LDQPDSILSREIAVHLQLALALVVACMLAPEAQAGEVEVLHYWTSGGEAQSLTELKSLIAERGHVWKDFVVPGGGGGRAMAELERRIQTKNPPAAANIKGYAMKEWAERNVLADLDVMAQFDQWDSKIPGVIAEQMKHKGSYVAVPVNVHRVNWLWANSQVLKAAGVTGMPTTLEAFFSAADRIKRNGALAVAHGNQDWQNYTLFETLVLAMGGADFYRKALVQREPDALKGETLRQAILALRRVKGYTDAASNGREWSVTTDLVVKGRAGFQFMGDWAKGEFLAAGQRAGNEFLCAPAPDTQLAFTYNVDSFAMFRLAGWEAQKAQGYLAYTLLGEKFQTSFNRRKGSIPVRLDIPLTGFDECAQRSRKDFAQTDKTQTLVPSVAHGMGQPTRTQAAMMAAVHAFWQDDTMTPAQLQERLSQSP